MLLREATLVRELVTGALRLWLSLNPGARKVYLGAVVTWMISEVGLGLFFNLSGGGWVVALLGLVTRHTLMA